MPVLRNTRHERFAQELAAGKSASEAYVLAGFRANRGNASTLKQQEDVLKRVAEILKQKQNIETKAVARAVERGVISKERVLVEIAKIAFADIDERKITPGDKRAALVDLGRELGMFVRQVEIRPGAPGNPIDAVELFGAVVIEGECQDVTRENDANNAGEKE